MSKKTKNRNLFKLILSILIANGIRLIRIIPNNDPIMSMALPYSRRSSILISFLFPFITMASFDFVTGYVGLWTVGTSITYGALGVLFYYLLKDRKKVGIIRYLGYGAVGVLIFDFITGVLMTPLLFAGMTFTEAFLGQIPFTALHLLTSSAFILVVTPLLDKEVLTNSHLDDSKVKAAFARLYYGLSRAFA